MEHVVLKAVGVVFIVGVIAFAIDYKWIEIEYRWWRFIGDYKNKRDAKRTGSYSHFEQF